MKRKLYTYKYTCTKFKSTHKLRQWHLFLKKLRVPQSCYVHTYLRLLNYNFPFFSLLICRILGSIITLFSTVLYTHGMCILLIYTIVTPFSQTKTMSQSKLYNFRCMDLRIFVYIKKHNKKVMSL